ncbi:MAG: Gfo/Idh/MocA family oxidoreductase [Clostridia bacterium]|nr:Gfo/Idh/MocA family oxidoreductase [Clostridia bacterium]
MEKLKIGIIGCGGIANAKHMPALAKVPQCEMVAFCDLVVDRAEAAAKKFGTPDAKVYTDYKELLADKSIDVVHVLTPNIDHSYITVDALEAGKHVMCEKPMAINSVEAKKMLDAAKRTGKKLTIGYQNRQRNDAMLVKEMCDNGELGDIYYARATALRRRGVPTWGVFIEEEKQGGGPLIDIGTHALDLTLWCMNNYKPKYCVGQTFHKLNDQKNTGNPGGDWNSEKFTTEDSAFGFIVMENGAVINLESSWAINLLDTREAITTLAGTKAGADMLDGVRINGVMHGKQYVTKPDLNVRGIPLYEGSGAPTAGDMEAYRWINSIINDTEPFVLPEQAYCVTRILEGIYTSAKTGKPYYFED